MGDRRRLGAILLALGLIIAGAGVAGALSEGATTGPTATPGASVGPTEPTATPTASPTASPTPSPTPTAAPTPDPEALIRDLLADLVAAIRAGDVVSMLPRVHPAVTERYGEAACQEALSTRAADPTYEIVVRTVRPQAPWDYVTDDLTTMIADAWTVDIDLTSAAGRT